MSTPNQQSGDERLGRVLREARPQPGLPPRFQQNVWRRIEQPDTRNSPASWVEILAALFLKPRFALTTICAVLVAGALLGSWTGSAEARQVAQERYVASVIMPVGP
jgi:hypothetical protein